MNKLTRKETWWIKRYGYVPSIYDLQQELAWMNNSLLLDPTSRDLKRRFRLIRRDLLKRQKYLFS